VDDSSQKPEEKYDEEELENIKIRNVREDGDKTFTVSNLITVKELKDLYLEEVEDDHTLRLMYGGQEMKDQKVLASYNVASNMVIIGMYRD